MRRLCFIQQGFAAIAAIFLLVVLAALGAFMLTFSNTQQLTSAQDLQGSRAYWAARAGLEWAVSSVIANPAQCPVPPAPFIVEGFTLTMVCTRQVYNEGAGNVTLFNFGATATQGGAAGALGFIERSVSASIER